ncbi:hypothetical protein Tco_0411614 [Tanacetum coccineum]
MPPKRTLTSEAPAMTQAAIRKLVADSVTAALEAQATTMANADNTNRNTGERENPDRPTFVSTDWRHPWDTTLRTLPKSRMTKQGNFTQRTPQAKKQSDQASRQVSKQASGSTNTPYDVVFPATGPSLGTTQPTLTITSNTEDSISVLAFTNTPSNGASGEYHRAAHPPTHRSETRVPNQARAYRPDLTSVQRTKYLHRAAKRKGTERITVDLQYLVESESKFRVLKQLTCRTWTLMKAVPTQLRSRDRLGSRNVHSRLGQWRSLSKSPPSSDSEDSRRKRRRRVSSSSEDTSDNEDAETGHWKSKNKYRGDETRDMSASMASSKGRAHYYAATSAISSEEKKRRSLLM